MLKINRAYDNPDYNEDMRNISWESMLSAKGAKVIAEEKGAFEQVTAVGRRWGGCGCDEHSRHACMGPCWAPTTSQLPFRRTQQVWSDSRVVQMLKKKKTEFTSVTRNDLVSGDERFITLGLAAAGNAHAAFPWRDIAEPPTKVNTPLPSLPAVEDVLRQA